jgi:hypothetical protein
VRVNVAIPPLTALDPRLAEPSLKLTLPVAVAGDTFAVSVTLWPAFDGFAEEVRVVVLVTWFTDCAKVVEVLAAKFASPL